jgi:hypothetical protein
MAETFGRQAEPVVLPDGGGLWVPASLAAELAAALQLLDAFVRGTPPPAVCRAPRLPRSVASVMQAATDAAVRHRRREARSACAAATVPPVPVVASAQTKSISGEEIGTGEAATILRVTEQRVRQLAASGELPGRKGPRDVWLFRREEVRRFRLNVEE